MGIIKNPTVVDIIAYLTRCFIAAINARDFDSKIWDNISPSIETYPQRLTGLQKSLSGKQAFIESMIMLAKECPEWNIRLKNLSVSINDAADYAEVFAYSRASGEPIGIARAVLTRIEWQLIKGKWLFVTHEIMPGLEM